MKRNTEGFSEARILLLDLLQRERAAIIDAGTDWIIRKSPDLRGRRPRAETSMLVEREFEAYRDRLIDDNSQLQDAFIEFTTSFRANSEFRISTLLLGFLCFKRGVEEVIESGDLGPQHRLEIIRILDELYFDAAIDMVDLYADKLLKALQQTQHQLMQREKMAALGGLVAGVAHEINTPMGVAVTAASLLRDRVRDVERDLESGQLRKRALESFIGDATEAAELTLGNLRRAADLVTSFKKIAVDQSNAIRRRVQLGPYLREVIASLGPLYKRTPHRLDLVIDESVEAILDAGALSQILTNFVQNALIHGFTDEQPGLMTICLQRCDDQQIELSFSDNGSGLSASARERLFEPFFTTRRGSGGSGLGLHIVHNLVAEVLCGTITVSSSPGRGTTFRIRFPFDPGPALNTH
ncbi:MAG TPA: sensor histidine kinase [Nannocystis exedens]|nr:sensor histidine kinase [Nannocystis exedens]